MGVCVHGCNMVAWLHAGMHGCMSGVWDGTRGTYVEINGNDSVPQRRVERQVPTVVPPIGLGHPGVGESAIGTCY